MSLPARGSSVRSDDWIERVREANDIVEVIGQSVTLKRAGRNWVGVCPFHKEKSPSFSVNAERQFYHCFGCKAGGDVFRFVMDNEKIGFVEAAEMLSHRAGIPVPERRPGERSQRAAVLEALEAATVAYEQWLADPERGNTARAYLEQRGITRDTQRAFRLGLAPPGWTPLADRLRGRVTEDVLLEAGLVARREQKTGVYDRFRDRLMVPLVASGGAVIGFGGRTLGEDGPKYLNSPETPVYRKGSYLYGFDAARRPAETASEFVLVEGYFDVIALHQAGITHAIATSGTALTADQARAMRRVVPGVALTFDGDDAGREAMMRSLDVLLGEGLDVAILTLPVGQDPDTFVREHGYEGWARLRAEALDPVGFIQRNESLGPGVGDPRERGAQSVVRLARGIGDPIRQRLLLERAEAVFRIPVAVLARSLAHGSARNAGSRESSVTPLPAIGARGTARPSAERALERRLITALLIEPGSLADVAERLTPEDFGDLELRGLAERLWSAPETMYSDEATGALARELVALAEGEMNWRAEAAGAARRLEQRRLKARQREIREAMSTTADFETIRALQAEALTIGNRLGELEREIGTGAGSRAAFPTETTGRS